MSRNKKSCSLCSVTWAETVARTYENALKLDILERRNDGFSHTGGSEVGLQVYVHYISCKSGKNQVTLFILVSSLRMKKIKICTETPHNSRHESS